MDSQYFFDPGNLIIAGSSQIEILIGGSPVVIQLNNNIQNLNDSVSLVCGDGTGYTFCGNKTLVIWDLKNNNEVNL